MGVITETLIVSNVEKQKTKIKIKGNVWREVGMRRKRALCVLGEGGLW